MIPPKSTAQVPLAQAPGRPPPPGPGIGPFQVQPWTMDDRLIWIEAMGKRIAGLIESMCSIREVTASSEEAKEKAVRTFYDKLLVVERQLARIHDDFKLQ